jgi:hypothetical protein
MGIAEVKDYDTVRSTKRTQVIDGATASSQALRKQFIELRKLRKKIEDLERRATKAKAAKRTSLTN